MSHSYEITHATQRQHQVINVQYVYFDKENMAYVYNLLLLHVTSKSNNQWMYRTSPYTPDQPKKFIRSDAFGNEGDFFVCLILARIKSISLDILQL